MIDMRSPGLLRLVLVVSALAWTVAATSQHEFSGTKLMPSPFEDDRPDNCPPWYVIYSVLRISQRLYLVDQ